MISDLLQPVLDLTGLGIVELILAGIFIIALIMVVKR